MSTSPGITLHNITLHTLGDGRGITVATAVPPPPPAVLSLDAATYSGSGPWIDSVAGRSFTLFGGVTYDTANGGSLMFDPGGQQYADCTSSLSTLSTWSVEAWHYYSDINQGAHPCIVTEIYPGTNRHINYALGGLQTNGNELQAGFYSSGFWATPPIYLNPNTWNQIVGTYDGATVKLYINNTLIEQYSIVRTPLSSGAGIRLIRRWDGGGNFWGGKLAIVNIYDHDIDTAGVAASWAANHTRFGL